MFNRRSFFRRVFAIAAVVALAPEIAFRSKLELPTTPPLDLQEMIGNVYSILHARKNVETIDIYTDSAGFDSLKRNYPEVFRGFQRQERDSGFYNTRPAGILEQLRSMGAA